MDIKISKYNFNDNLWFIHPNNFKPVQAKVTDITVNLIGQETKRPTTDGTKGLVGTGEYKLDHIKEIYKLVDGSGKEYMAPAKLLFLTKEELIESLK